LAGGNFFCSPGANDFFSPDFFREGKNPEKKMIDIDFEKMGGLIPAVIQDNDTGEVLMLGFMNREAWENTFSTGKATFFSRTRNKLWVKGETSGNVQIVKEIRIDCDNDTVLLKIDQVGGAACHTGYKSCFFRKIENGELKTIGTPIFDPNEVYKK
jgi:phosphoribosyl-AMP cyclohydrolase